MNEDIGEFDSWFVEGGAEEQREQAWRERADELGAFFEAEGRWPNKQLESEVRLSNWHLAQRGHNRKGAMLPSRHQYLDLIASGWDTDHREQLWRNRLAHFASYHSVNGRWPSQVADDAIERSLALWHREQLTVARSGSGLAPNRRRLLDEVAPGWMSSADLVWERKAKELAAFRVRENRWPTGSSKDPAESKIAAWLYTMRGQSGAGTIPSERAAYLDECAPGWSAAQHGTWEACFSQLSEQVMMNSLSSPCKSDGPEEDSIWQWLSRQRYRMTAGRLSIDKVARLDGLVPGWREKQNPFEAWAIQADALAEFHSRDGRWPSSNAIDAQEKQLGNWLAKQRSMSRGKSRSENFTEKKREYLDDKTPGWLGSKGAAGLATEGGRSGPCQDAPNAAVALSASTWVDTANALSSYVSVNNLFPMIGRTSEEDELAVWLFVQRGLAREGDPTFTPERRAHLDKVAPGWLPDLPKKNPASPTSA